MHSVTGHSFSCAKLYRHLRFVTVRITIRLKLQHCSCNRVDRAALRKFLISKGVVVILKIHRVLAFSAVLACALTLTAQDKDSFTPMPLDSGFGKMDVTPPRSPPSRSSRSSLPKKASFRMR